MHIAFIYMASGQGRRFGGNKLLAMLAGRPLYQYGLDNLCSAARFLERQHQLWHCRVYVVSPYEEILASCVAVGAAAVPNGRASEGMAASVRAGVGASEDADVWAFFPADMPFLTAPTIGGFTASFLQSRRSLGCVICGGILSSPAAFSRLHKDELLALRGDQGGRSLLRRHDRHLWTYGADSSELADIDTPADMDRARRRLERQL